MMAKIINLAEWKADRLRGMTSALRSSSSRVTDAEWRLVVFLARKALRRP